MLDVKDSDLLSHCEKCEGLGLFVEQSGPELMEKHCPECEKGIKLTQSGRAILSFVSEMKRRGLL
jgi:hypothetical protein